ncbi:MAG: NUDIX domain-containing protein [Pseudomonadota bacterium]
MTHPILTPLSRIWAQIRPPTRKQAAALCWREGSNGIEVLLITTRRTGRWTPPKGGLGRNTPHVAARMEAEEEAGAFGEISDQVAGTYRTMKLRKKGYWAKLSVAVYPMRVDRMEDEYLEKGQRKLEWFAPSDAARRVREPELRRLLREFKPV